MNPELFPSRSHSYLEGLSSLPIIRALPEFLINQIKAGEVIERPANLVKELLENSLDAKASKIYLNIENGGLDLIEIRDNGKGIPFNQLPIAFERHTTSKIFNFEDLFKLKSYGFRGEALASIASISRTICTSFPQIEKQQKDGGKIEIDGGKIISHIPISQSDQIEFNTTFLIRDLFYNTPARLKFLKSKHSEKIQLKKIIEAFILNWPSVEFSIAFDNKIWAQYPICLSQLDFVKRVSNIYSYNIETSKECSHLLLSERGDKTSLQGHLFIHNSAKNNLKHFLFVNKRLIFDKSIHQRVIYTFEKNMPPNYSYDYCLFIEVPSDEVDINVHPHKTSVKFEKAALIHSLIGQSLKNIILQNFSPKTAMRDSEEAPFLGSQELIQKSLSGHNQNELLTTFSPIALTGPFAIILIESSHYLIDKVALAKFEIKNYFKHHYPLLDDEIIPLIISGPIKIFSKITPDLTVFLKTIGIDIDEIEQNNYLIRSIPAPLKSIDYKLFISKLINFYIGQNSSTKTKIELFFNFLEQKDLWVSPIIDKPIPEINISNLDIFKKEKIIKELSEELLISIMRAQ